MEIVQYALNVYQYLKRDVDIRRVVERQYAVDVLTHLFMMTKAIKLIMTNVPFVEFLLLNLMRRLLKG